MNPSPKMIMLSFALCTTAVKAADKTFESHGHVNLVELFTSEGCSSCPPAERWFEGVKTTGQLWKDVIPVAYHVDYWDYLGWKDIFSKEEFSDRHHAYGAAWKERSVYTPSIVVNGQIWPDWRSRKAVPTDALATRADALAAPTIRLTLRDKTHFEVTMSGGQQGCYQAHVALLNQETVSKVTAGENKGETLAHAFSAIEVGTAKFQKEPLGQTSTGTKLLAAKGSINLAANELKLVDAVATWVTRCDSMTPLQATGGALRD